MRIGLCIDGTFMPSYEGAPRRYLGLARYLAEAGLDPVVIHSFRNWSDMELIASQQFRTYFVSPDIYYHHPELMARLLTREGIDAIVMKNFGTICTVGRELKSMVPNLRLFFEVHDIASEYSRLHGEQESVLQRMQLAESSALCQADLCVCFTEEDRAAALSLVGKYADLQPDDFIDVQDRIVRMPFGCDSADVQAHGTNIDAQTVLFLGNLYHPPNAQAAHFLREQVYPQVISVLPQAQFLIAGPAPEKMIKHLTTPSFQLLDAVPDLNSVFARTTLAVAPIFAGTGIKVKILDYCAAGLPVLCSSQAVRGIACDADDRNAFVLEDDPSRYSSQILALLRQPDRLVELSKAAYRLSQTQSWSAIVGETIELYQAFCSKPRRPDNSAMAELLRHNDDIFVPFFLKDTFRQRRFETAAEVPDGMVLLGGRGQIDAVKL